MTLRVYIDVLPLGNETEAYELHQIDIHNMGRNNQGLTEYSFEIDEVGAEETVQHNRDHGPFVLIQKVLDTETARELYSN